MLDDLIEAGPAPVRADRHAEAGGQEQDGQHLVDAAHPAGVVLAEVERPGLEELLEKAVGLALVHVRAVPQERRLAAHRARDFRERLPALTPLHAGFLSQILI